MALSVNQLYVLKLLEIAGKIDGKTKLQKLMFLAETERGAPTTYKFEKYHYGPFSFELSDDLDALAKTGFVSEEKNGYGSSDGNLMIKCTFSLTQDGKKELKENEAVLDANGIKIFEEVTKRWNNTPLDSILKYVYQKYMNDNNRELAIAG